MSTNEPVTISRETVFNGHGLRTPFSWLYTVTVPGEPFPFKGTGADWARKLARRKADGRPVVETWR